MATYLNMTEEERRAHKKAIAKASYERNKEARLEKMRTYRAALKEKNGNTLLSSEERSEIARKRAADCKARGVSVGRPKGITGATGPRVEGTEQARVRKSDMAVFRAVAEQRGMTLTNVISLAASMMAAAHGIPVKDAAE